MSDISSEKNTSIIYSSDQAFNSLYTGNVFEAASKHWTPVEVAVKAASFLATYSGVKILDIGSGAGKFCLVAAHHSPRAYFTGIEQREYLVTMCNKLKKDLHLTNVTFFHKNMTDEDFSAYNNFYFYNSFYENKTGTQKIDYEVRYDEKLYDYYNLVLYKKLQKLPAGTRIVTYHSLGIEMPPGYEIVNSEFADFLKFWVKL